VSCALFFHSTSVSLATNLTLVLKFTNSFTGIAASSARGAPHWFCSRKSVGGRLRTVKKICITLVGHCIIEQGSN
jgi:hypothetical protein